MSFFNLIEGHKIWGWLSKQDSPWEIIDPSSKRSIYSTILELAANSEEVVKHEVDLDVTLGPVVIQENVIIGSSVRIEGPAFIESGAKIKHSAYIRPGTYISSGCLVGHASEVKNTLMMPNSKIPHFNYVGDSILGWGCNLGAGTKIANVRLDGLTIPIRFADGTVIDSEMRKLGALIGDNSSLGCNVVTNPGVVIQQGSMVPPNTTVSGYWQ